LRLVRHLIIDLAMVRSMPPAYVKAHVNGRRTTWGIADIE